MKKFVSGIFSAKQRRLRPYKIEDRTKTWRRGVAVTSLKELKKEFTKEEAAEVHVVLSSDGTEVDEDEYLQSLAPHTCLMVLQPGEEWLPDIKSSVTGLITAIDNIRKTSHEREELISSLQSLLLSSHNSVVESIIGNVINALDHNISASSREEDPEWFKGLHERFLEKDEVMKDAARRRMRSYLYSAKDFIKTNCKGSQKQDMDLLLQEFEKLLKKQNYYEEIFSRLSNASHLRICDAEGWFRCEGPYDQEDCDMSDHMINPYANYASRIMFSSWNLDHRIEKSREILPSLASAVENIPARRRLNWMYFYDLLFTRVNLRLVHVVCHNKKEHSEAKCDPQLFYH